MRGGKKIFHTNRNQKKAGVPILLSTKQTLKNVLRDKEGHYMIIKGSIQQEDVTIVNIYAPNIGSPQYERQLLIALKGDIDSGWGLLTPHLQQWTDHPDRKSTRKHGLK